MREVVVLYEARGFSGATTRYSDVYLEDEASWPRVLVLREKCTEALLKTGYNVSGTIVCGEREEGLVSAGPSALCRLQGVEEIVGYRYRGDTLTLELRVRYPEWKPRTPEEKALVLRKSLEAVDKVESDLKRELLLRSLYVLRSIIVVMIVLLYVADRCA